MRFVLRVVGGAEEAGLFALAVGQFKEYSAKEKQVN